MKEKLTFIHAADLHLGARLDLPPGAEHHAAAVEHAYFALVNAAVENHVQAVFLAGDIFDGQSRSVSAYRAFREGLRTLQEHHIPVFLLAGNHDPKDSWPLSQDLGDGVVFFGAEKTEAHPLYDAQGKQLALVFGRSYKTAAERKKFHVKELQTEKDCWNICLLHSELATSGTYMPVAGSLTHPGLDYLALGHVHDRRVVRTEGPAAAYPGATQAKDMGEMGAGYAYLVTLAEGEAPQMEPIPVSELFFREVLWTPETVFETEEEILAALAEEAPGLLEDSLSTVPEGAEVVLRLKMQLTCAFYGEDATAEVRLTEEADRILRQEVSVPGVYHHSVRLSLLPRPLSAEDFPLLSDLRKYFEEKEDVMALLPKVFSTPMPPEDRDDTRVELSESDLLELREAAGRMVEDALGKEVAR